MDGSNNMMAIDSHPPSTPSKHTSPPSPSAVHPPAATSAFSSNPKSPTNYSSTQRPRQPTPSAYSISSDSVIVVDPNNNPGDNPENEEPAADDENNDEESGSEDDDEDDEDSESSSGEADEEGDGGDAAEVEHLTVPLQDRVVSSSSSAAAGGPDTDTDAEQARRQTVQGDSTAHPDGNDPTGASGAVTDTANADPNAPNKKPKSKIRRRLSPSPPPIAKPPPRITVRLNIPLGGPSNYEVNILQLSKAAGQGPPTPPLPPRLGSDSESSSEDEQPPPPEAINVPVPVAKRRRRRAREYDLNDPFIDDSDLTIDAPTHFAQTKQQGFYVSSGDVALVKDKSPQKPVRNGPGRPPKSTNGGLSDSNAPGPGGGRRRQGPSLTSLLMNATAVAEAPSKVVPLTTVPGQAPSQADAAASSAKPQSGVGTRDSPIALLDDDDPEQREAKRIKLDEEVGKISTTGGFVAYGNGDTAPDTGSIPNLSMVSIGPSDSMLNAAASSAAGDANGPNGKKRKISKEDLERIFHPVVNNALRDLKKAIDEANWAVRGKFPPHLKPLLQQTATVALRHGDYNDNFFDYLPTIFPYNRFTMMKLTSRLMYTEHQKFLQLRQDALLEELRKIAIEDFPKAQEEYARAQASWEERQKRKAENKEEGMDVDTPSRAHSPNPAESDVPNGKEKGEKIPGTREREDRPPQQRFRFTDAIKSRVWGLVHLSNESARLTSVMHGWDNTVPVATEQSLRKSLYSKITAVFPEGWMNSQTISREVSNMKLRLKKEVELERGKMEE